MSVEKNLELARRWFNDLWSKPDLDVADEIVDPEYAPDWIQIPAQGPDQIKHEIRHFRSIFPDLQYEIVDMVALADRVWVRYKGSGTQRGTAWGFEPTGRSIEFDGCSPSDPPVPTNTSAPPAVSEATATKSPMPTPVPSLQLSTQVEVETIFEVLPAV